MANTKMHSESTCRKPLTAKRLRELLEYNPATGNFYWKTDLGCHNKYEGLKAGGVNYHGYVRVAIDGVSYRANRLAWLYMTGDWPSQLIDHVNRNKADDRWENLRLATRSQNRRNAGRAINNTSGLTGVSPAFGKWRAQISFEGKKKYLGLFTTKEAARAAYVSAAKTLFGEFFPGEQELAPK